MVEYFLLMILRKVKWGILRFIVEVEEDEFSKIRVRVLSRKSKILMREGVLIVKVEEGRWMMERDKVSGEFFWIKIVNISSIGFKRVVKFSRLVVHKDKAVFLCVMRNWDELWQLHSYIISLNLI